MLGLDIPVTQWTYPLRAQTLIADTDVVVIVIIINIDCNCRPPPPPPPPPRLCTQGEQTPFYSGTRAAAAVPTVPSPQEQPAEMALSAHAQTLCAASAGTTRRLFWTASFC